MTTDRPNFHLATRTMLCGPHYEFHISVHGPNTKLLFSCEYNYFLFPSLYLRVHRLRKIKSLAERTSFNAFLFLKRKFQTLFFAKCVCCINALMQNNSWKREKGPRQTGGGTQAIAQSPSYHASEHHP